MKNFILLSIFSFLLFSCSNDDEAQPKNNDDLEAVLNVIKGERLTQGNFSLWFDYSNSDVITFVHDNTLTEVTYMVDESYGIDVAAGDANQGIRAFFGGTTSEGDEIESYVTLLDEYNQKWGVHITANRNGAEFMDQLFELP